MLPIVLTIDIDRPPQEVFAYATDPARFSEWQLDVATVHSDANGSAPAGAAFTTTRRIGRAERTMTQQVTLSDPPYSWQARGIAGTIRPNVVLQVEPLHDGASTHATFTFTFDGYGTGEQLLPIIRRAAARQAPESLRNLRDRLEAANVTAS